LQPPFQKASDAVHHSLSSPQTLYHNNGIVGVPAEAVTALFQFLVQIIEKNISEQLPYPETLQFLVQIIEKNISEQLPYPETLPYMTFLFPGSSPGQAWLTALHSGFLQTPPRDDALVFG
jgi:hypothetical protein